jgi:putative tryptophan/tyrosine transport system substrate-binding protein
MAMPCFVRAQQAMPMVGVVTPASATTTQFPPPFLRAMREFGWEEGRNYRVSFLYAEGQNDRFPLLVGELVGQRVNVIVALGDPVVEAARHATTTISIVGTSADMVKGGFVASMTHPGGNITGVNFFAREMDVKKLELLHETLPDAKRIGLLLDPVLSWRPQLDDAARKLNLELVVVIPQAGSREEVAHSLDALESGHIDAVSVASASPTLAPLRRLIVERLNRAHLPAIYETPETAAEGGLLAYGPRLQLIIRHVAGLVTKILNGARPEDLPIEQPEKIDLVVNLKTAKALGITIPPSILTRADEVIE